ncbi:MAG: YkgJ family cysteine cluster protein [Anaerohalosphaeraceae bacterium]|nr:YkgJ family cysteine cluster protein [Anaerohalosphaeraceae bacterium]
MSQNEEITRKTRQIYDWIDKEVDSLQNSCESCGKCCDFADFGHKLYVSPPEMVYFAQNVTVLPMTKSICPYQKDGLCSVYEHRFAGCRIFSCGKNAEARADLAEKQAILSEKALGKFKDICITHDLDYFYTDLATALNR